VTRVRHRDGSPAADVVVVGGGVAGVTAAALLALAGADVLLVERHNVVGGCASFFRRDGWRFDVGATLVSGFGPRGIHARLGRALEMAVAAERVEPAMAVHLPDATVVRFGDERWPAERLRAFGAAAEPFWRRQERIADLAWDLAAGLPMLPHDLAGIAAAAGAFRPRHLPLLPRLGRSLATLYPAAPPARLRAFVDAQLLITAQTGADGADLIYGATALDLARAGTFHLDGGPAAIATATARALRRLGGRIAYRRTAVAIELDRRGRVGAVRLDGGERIATRQVVGALPAAAVAALLPEPPPFARRLAGREQRWGAFMAYVALPAGAVPDEIALHHQVVADTAAPPGEGNTVFLSFSGPGERGRAPAGGRALTISTHTDVARWERAHRDGGYDALAGATAERLRAALERVVPGAWERAAFVATATPHTFERYTGRPRGLVGGVPQSPWNAVLGALGHRSGVPGLVLAGDTVFPGQSTVGASLGGIAAARAAGARVRLP
jgi:C-3',4' desaturase CrtD